MKSNDLTPSEVSCLSLLAEGLSNREIAERRVCAETTVKSILQGVYTKIGVNSDRAAIAYAYQNGVATIARVRKVG